MEVNLRVLVHEMLARHSGELTGEISWQRSAIVLS